MFIHLPIRPSDCLKTPLHPVFHHSIFFSSCSGSYQSCSLHGLIPVFRIRATGGKVKRWVREDQEALGCLIAGSRGLPEDVPSVAAAVGLVQGVLRVTRHGGNEKSWSFRGGRWSLVVVQHLRLRLTLMPTGWSCGDRNSSPALCSYSKSERRPFRVSIALPACNAVMTLSQVKPITVAERRDTCLGGSSESERSTRRFCTDQIGLV